MTAAAVCTRGCQSSAVPVLARDVGNRATSSANVPANVLNQLSTRERR